VALTDFDPADLRELKPDQKGQFRLTCSRIHLTYPTQFDEPLATTIGLLEKHFSQRSYSVISVSAIQETGLCRLIGYDHPHTHIAVEIKRDTPGLFSLSGLSVYSIHSTLPHIRLVKEDRHWDHIWNTYHYKEKGASPLQRSNGQPLRRMPPKTVQASEKTLAYMAHHEAAKKAYDAFERSNTSIIQMALASCRDRSKGSKIWVSDERDAVLIAEFFRISGKAVVFTNDWSGDRIAKGIQTAINETKDIPNLIVLLITHTEEHVKPHERKICDLFDHIVSGTLKCQTSTQRDMSLAMCRPNLLVFSSVDPSFLQRSWEWSILLPSHPTGTSHILASHDTFEYIKNMATAIPDPEPDILSIREVISALLPYVEVVQGTSLGIGLTQLAALQMATRIVFLHCSRKMVQLYWDRGYRPVIALVNVGVCKRGRYKRSRITDIFDVTDQTVAVDPYDLTKSIGRKVQIGNVVILSDPVTDEEKEQQRLDDNDGFPGRISLEEIRQTVINMGLVSQDQLTAFENEASRQTNPATLRETAELEKLHQTIGTPFRDSIDPKDVELLSRIGDIQAMFGFTKGYATRTPFGEIISNGLIHHGKCIIIEIDVHAPTKFEAYKMLYWFEKDYRIIRMRADDLGTNCKDPIQCTVRLEWALGKYEPFQYLDLRQGRRSWSDLQEHLAPYMSNMVPLAQWWKDNMDQNLDPHHDDIFRASIQTPRPATPNSEPPRSPRPRTPPEIQWAVYLRTAGSRILQGQELENDISMELARQQSACFQYAQKHQLVPVAGQCCFVDRCDIQTPPQDRPGLQALLKSGARGILCYDKARMAPEGTNLGPWLDGNNLRLLVVA
jgi:hypothetical protein